MKKRVITIFVLLIIFLLAMVYIFSLDRQYASKDKVDVVSCIDDRVCIEEEQIIKIGNNEKELQNGYYDVLLEKNEFGFELHVNKLWKTEFNESLLELNYVDEVTRFLLSRVSSNAAVSEISNYIIEGYTLSKNGEKYIKELNLEQETIIFESKNYELVIEVKHK